MQSEDDGWSVLEVIITLGITGLLLASNFPTIRAALKWRTELTLVARRDHDLLHAKLLLSQSFSELDTHRMVDGVRIQFGELRLENGALLSVHQAAEKLRPDSASNTITLLALRNPEFLYLSELSQIGTGTIAGKICSAPQMADAKGVLGISPDGFAELLILAINSLGGDCYTLSLQQRPSLLFAELDIRTIRAVAVIKSVRSFYLSNGGDLRIVDTIGDKIIQNQPLISAIGNFRIKQQQLAGGLISHSVALTTIAGYAYEFPHLTQLGRAAHYSQLLNRQ